MPFFSVLISVYKTRHLSEALDCLEKQSYKNFETVLVDDRSPEEVGVHLEKHWKLSIRYYKNEENLGSLDPSSSWNKGLEYCEGDIVCLMGDDDLIDPNYFEIMANLIVSNPDSAIYRSRLRIVDDQSRVLVFGPGLPNHETWDEFLYQRNTNKRPHSTSEFCIRRKTLEDLGGWKSQPMAIGSDDLTYLELSLEKGIVSTNDTWASWRRHRKQISTSRKHDHRRLIALSKLGESERCFIIKNEPHFIPKELLLADLPGQKAGFVQKVRSGLVSFLGKIGLE